MKKFFEDRSFNWSLIFFAAGTVFSCISGVIPLIVFGFTSIFWAVMYRFTVMHHLERHRLIKQELQDVMEDRDRYHELYDTYWTKYDDKLKENLELAEKGSEQVKINLGLTNENAELREQLAEANAKLAKYEHIDPEQEVV